MPGLVTATGVLGFLSDEEPELKVFALQTLNDDIDTVWTEVAGALSQMYANSPPSPPAYSTEADCLTDLQTTVRRFTKMILSPSASWPPWSSPRSTTTFRLIMRA